MQMYRSECINCIYCIIQLYNARYTEISLAHIRNASDTRSKYTPLPQFPETALWLLKLPIIFWPTGAGFCISTIFQMDSTPFFAKLLLTSKECESSSPRSIIWMITFWWDGLPSMLQRGKRWSEEREIHRWSPRDSTMSTYNDAIPIEHYFMFCFRLLVIISSNLCRKRHCGSLGPNRSMDPRGEASLLRVQVWTWLSNLHQSTLGWTQQKVCQNKWCLGGKKTTGFGWKDM